MLGRRQSIAVMDLASRMRQRRYNNQTARKTTDESRVDGRGTRENEGAVRGGGGGERGVVGQRFGFKKAIFVVSNGKARPKGKGPNRHQETITETYTHKFLYTYHRTTRGVRVAFAQDLLPDVRYLPQRRSESGLAGTCERPVEMG